MSSSIFDAALHDINRSGRAWSAPISFQNYLKTNDLPKKQTASVISVQSLDGLDAALRRENVMIFRLGVSADGSTTQFALARAPASINEFFLIDNDIFNVRPETFVPDVPISELLPFQLLGGLPESGTVNFAIASGLLGHALRIDHPNERVIHATGSSCYTFKVAPHAMYPVVWNHNNGQVRLDALIFAKRRGAPCLFVIEAKRGPMSSLSKVLLAYATSAVATKPVPADVPVIPVYLRAWQVGPGRTRFAIAECDYPSRRRTDIPVASLKTKEISVLDVVGI